MADWSQLPKDLLDLIAKHLKTSSDVQRFRSVCSTWRYSVVSPKRLRLPPRFPVFPPDGMLNTSFGFYLSKRTIFLLASGSSHPHVPTGPLGWLIKIEQDANVSNRVQLLNPLSRSRFDSLPEEFPKVLNLLNLSVFELGQEYVLHCINDPGPSSWNYLGNLYMEKVVLLTVDNVNDFVLLTIHVSGKLAMFRSVLKKWTIIQDMPSPYDDVILYKGNFYAVDNTGRTVLVGLDLSVSLIAKPVFGGDKKFLVESRDELLLVDMYLSIEKDSGSMVLSEEYFEEYFENLACYMNERTVRFKVFRLDEAGQKWVGMKNLGDQVLFLGDDCTFSASAKDMHVSRGNCIIFVDNFFYLNEEEYGSSGNHDIGVFDLENDSIGPLVKYAPYSDLFWPPPQWLSSMALEQV
ncbi:hypothetical protein SLA2020_169580 [Shorea laevis]